VLVNEEKLDVLLRERLTAMRGTPHLFFDSGIKCAWKQASSIAAKAQGKGSINHARNIRRRCLAFIEDPGNLPLHRYGLLCPSVFDGEDVSQAVQSRLLELRKGRWLVAKNV
jgi:hypothetical protein